MRPPPLPAPAQGWPTRQPAPAGRCVLQVWAQWPKIWRRRTGSVGSQHLPEGTGWECGSGGRTFGSSGLAHLAVSTCRKARAESVGAAAENFEAVA
eukprot:364723-Chlamydomonas_euryale.AAC.7